MTGVTRDDDGVVVTTASEQHRFDAVVIACHSDQALTMLHDPSPAETEILGSIALSTEHSDPAHRYLRSRIQPTGVGSLELSQECRTITLETKPS